MITEVKVSDLQQILQANRAAHREKFLKAQEVYRQHVIEWLEARLDDARNGRKLERAIRLPEPEEHTEDYDRVLKMLELNQHETIELSESEVATYVMDDWGWKHSFAQNTTSYL